MQIELFPRPHQLPAAVADFVGREELVQSAVDLITPFPQVVLLTGPVGAGKTTLAVHAAHRVANGFFPDGQLFVRLRGTTPHEVLGRFLAAFGLSVPGDFAARLSAYRDAVARQSLLLVLDDATSVQQVTPLLSPLLDVKLPDAAFYLWAGVPGGDDVEFARGLFAQ